MAPGLSSARQRRRCQGRAAAAASPSSPHLHISRRPLLYKPICICLLFPHTSSLRREEKSLLLGKFDAFTCALDSLSLRPPQGPYFIHVPFCASSSDIPCLLAPRCVTPTRSSFPLSCSPPSSYHLLSCFPSTIRHRDRLFPFLQYSFAPPR